jgi:hypothetical protein
MSEIFVGQHQEQIMLENDRAAVISEPEWVLRQQVADQVKVGKPQGHGVELSSDNKGGWHAYH